MRTASNTDASPRRPAGALLVSLIVVGIVLTGCVAQPSNAPTLDVETIAPTASSTPSATPVPTGAPTADPADPGATPLTCWTITVPDVAIAFTQTPEEFASVNPGLVASGAPSPCSLFASGADRAAAEQWFDGLVADGWAPDAAIEDDVYVSRNATSPSGAVAGYLVSKDANDPAAVTQFLTYTP